MCGFTFAQTTNIPDLNFETELVNLGIDSNGINGLILDSDALSVTTLNVSNQGISSLIGLEAFTNLESLVCSINVRV